MAVEHLKLEEELREAIFAGQLELHYQPQIDTGTGRAVSMEALVRWRHPKKGMIPPNDFIYVAERTGLIVDLGNWVLNEAARQCASWDAMNLDKFRVCVNMSPLQFNQPNIAANVAHFIESSGMDAHRLELELTESAIMTDAESNIEKLRALKAMGIGLAVDDFGTGYSSLSYLKRFPIDTLKIDQTFVADLASPDGEAIVDAILALAGTLNLQVVAEGVETNDQLNYLMAHKCDLLQGYYFERPVAAEEVPALMQKNYNELFTETKSVAGA